VTRQSPAGSQRVRVVSLAVAGGEAGAGHTFAQAAGAEEVLLLAAKLLVEQVVGDFDEAEDHVGGIEGVKWEG
jgi:hypothetical protein